MTLAEAFIIEGWTCRAEQSSVHGPVISHHYLIEVPINRGLSFLPYRLSMHLLGDGFFATDFSPVMWHGCADRFSNLTSHEGLYVNFCHLVRVCFGIFRFEIASENPQAVFVVCGSRTVGDPPASSDCNIPTRKYRLYKKVFVRIARECNFYLVDDAAHSLFLMSPFARSDSADDLLKAYWRIRASVDPLLGDVS